MFAGKIRPVPAGRPTIRTPEIVDAILADIEAGDSETTASWANGVSDDAWGDWKRSDPELSGRCKIARARGNRALREELKRTESKVRAHVCLHLLGCRDPELSARSRVEHAGSIAVTLSELLHKEAP